MKTEANLETQNDQERGFFKARLQAQANSLVFDSFGNADLYTPDVSRKLTRLASQIAQALLAAHASTQPTASASAPSQQDTAEGSVPHGQRIALSGHCDNGAHLSCSYPDECRCSCHVSSSSLSDADRVKELVDEFRFGHPPVQSLRFLEWEPLVDRITSLLSKVGDEREAQGIERAARACVALRENRPTTEKGRLIATECAIAIRALSPDPNFLNRVIEEERERCAKIAEKQAGKGRTIGDTKAIAATIRRNE